MTITAESLLEMSGSFWRTFTLHAAVKLDLFTIIGRDALSAEAVRQAVAGSERGVPRLLNALTAMGLLVRKGDAYANTEEGLALLSKDSPGYIGHMIMHHHHLVASWNRLAEAVLTGEPQRVKPVTEDETERESFLMGMFNIAMNLAPRIAEEVDLAGRRRLLDLGGGPGTYAIHFCLKNPELQATIFDMPTTRPFAEKTVRRFGLEGRVGFAGGDFLEDDIGKGYDAVWLSQILHGEGPEACETIVRKAASALAPGGVILIHEFFLNDSLDGPLHPAIFSLNMLVGTKDGQSYSEGQVRQMLENAGIEKIGRLPFRPKGDSGILLGIRPA